MAVLLALALVVPAIAVAAALLPATFRARLRDFAPADALHLGGAVAALAWLALLVASEVDDVVELDRFAADAPMAAAGLGAALLVTTGTTRGRRESVASGGALLAFTLGASASAGAGHGGGHFLAGVGGAAAIAAAPLVAARRWTVTTAASLLGVALLAAGLSRLEESRSTLRLVVSVPTPVTAGLALIAGATVLAWVGARQRRGSGAVLLPAGVLVAVRVVDLLAGHDVADLGPLTLDLRRAVGLALAVVALVVALRLPAGLPWSRRVPRPRPDPIAALALWALAVLAAVPDPAPGLLLAAAVVLMAAAGVPAVAVAAGPGVAALALELARAGDEVAAAFAGLAVATGVALTASLAPVTRTRARPLRAATRRSERRDDEDQAETRPPWSSWWSWLPVPRLAIGGVMLLAAWLTIAPGTWGWAGDASFAAWHRAASVAVPVAVLAVGVAGSTARLASPRGLVPLPVPVARGHGRIGAVAFAAAAAVLGASLAWLVGSSVFAG